MTWTRTKTLAAVLFVSLALNLFLAGHMAGRWGGWHGDRHWDHKPGWGAKIWLTWAVGDEAASKVTAKWEAHRQTMKPLRAEAKAKRRAVRAALKAEPFDADAYAAALEASRDHSSAIRAAHNAFMIDLAASLTPEQRAELAKHAGRGRWRRHHGE